MREITISALAFAIGIGIVVTAPPWWVGLAGGIAALALVAVASARANLDKRWGTAIAVLFIGGFGATASLDVVIDAVSGWTKVLAVCLVLGSGGAVSRIPVVARCLRQIRHGISGTRDKD